MRTEASSAAVLPGSTVGRSAPKVSVVIPTYNRAGYLREALESVLNQTYRNTEIIVADDGSTDETHEVLRPFIETGGVKYLYRENSGRPSVARNLGLRHVTGEYVCFLDSDDVLTENAIARGVGLLERHADVGMVCCNWIFFKVHFSIREDLEASWIEGTGYLDRIPAELIKVRGDGFVIFEEDFRCELFNSDFICTSNVITRKGMLDDAGYFDESLRIGEDCDLWLRLLEGKRLAYITDPLVYRRRHDGSITRDLAVNMIEDTKVIEKFMRKKRNLSSAAKQRLFRRLESYYFYTGYFFLNENAVAESRKRFFRTLRYNPSSYRNCRYFLISLLPLRAILLARRMKQRMRRPGQRTRGGKQHP